MAELVWDGKYRDGVRVERSRVATALETDELHQGDQAGGPWTEGAAADGVPWRNRLVSGDAGDVLASLRPAFAGRVALAYIDPPFDTGGRFDFQASIPGVPPEAPRVAIPAYEDARGLDAWLAWFADVATGMHELLADGASFYVHLDAHVAHYAKVVLDEVFGAGAFQREIVWRIGWVSGYKSRSRSWIRNHDTLLFYAKGGRPATFHKEYIPYPEGYVRRDGKPPRGAGIPVEDVWNGSALDRLDSIQIVSFSGEKVGYPTQKNEALLARIVRASSNPGDIVLDCFAGSGTTAVVAEKLGRRWIACDASPIALHATRKRLLALPRPGPFVVQRLTTRAPAPRAAGNAGKKVTFDVRVRVEGRRATLEIASFALARDALAFVPAAARRGIAHWSQWLDGYCVDWEHRAGVLNATSRVWRTRGQTGLPLVTTRAYPRSGRFVAMVRAYDVLGGATTTTVDIDV